MNEWLRRNDITTIALDQLIGANLDTSWLVDGWLGEEQIALLAGEMYQGKSWFALYLSLSLAFGQTWLQPFKVSAPRRVLFIDEDNPPRVAAKRIREFIVKRGLDPKDISDRFFYWAANGFNVRTLVDNDKIKGVLDTIKPDLVVIDSLYCFGHTDLSDQKAVGLLKVSLRHLQKTYGFAIYLLHHLKKTQFGEGTDASVNRIFGSTYITAMCDTIHLLRRVKDVFEVRYGKLRSDPDMMSKDRVVRLRIRGMKVGVV